MRSCMLVWLVFLGAMLVSVASPMVAVALSGVLALVTMLVFLSFGFNKSFREMGFSVLRSQFSVSLILFFAASSFVYYQLSDLVSATSSAGVDHGMWALARVFDVFQVWFGLVLILSLLSEAWLTFFASRPLSNWYLLNGVAVALAVGVVVAGEYFGLMVQAWLAAIVAYVVVFLLSVGGLRFDQERSRSGVGG